jgi:peptidoglycan/LPS O-acetylase OafA/YrhL
VKKLNSLTIIPIHTEDACVKIKHFYWIDWLRFGAAMLVVVCHARGYNWVDWGKLSPADHTRALQLFFLATRPAGEWVIVFFALSGFLVGGKVIEQSLKKTFDPLKYAIDRVTRIWLPLIPALIFTAAIECYLGFGFNWVGMLGNLAALQGVTCEVFGHNVPLWSLSYEIWFYVLAGCAALVVAKSGNAFWPFMGIALSFIVFTQLTVNYLNCWALGAFAYFLVSRRITGLGFIGLLLAFLGLVISQLQSDSVSIVKGALWFWGWLPSQNTAALVLSLGIGLILTDICHRQPHSPLAVKVERLGTRLAAFSYTLYLTHYPLLNLWIHFIPERSQRFDFISIVIFGSKILSCLLFAWLIYLPFEAQTAVVKIWLKRQFTAPSVDQELSKAPQMSDALDG